MEEENGKASSDAAQLPEAQADLPKTAIAASTTEVTEKAESTQEESPPSPKMNGISNEIKEEVEEEIEEVLEMKEEKEAVTPEVDEKADSPEEKEGESDGKKSEGRICFSLEFCFRGRHHQASFDLGGYSSQRRTGNTHRDSGRQKLGAPGSHSDVHVDFRVTSKSIT